MRVRKWLTLLVALAMTLSLLVVPALAENPVAGSGSLAGKTATFTITENPAERFMMGSDVVAKFHITVASSDTTPIRAFSFNLNATGLELATQKQAANGTFYFMPMNADTMLKPSGPYTVYDYTPGDDARNYFAAGGSDDGQGITTETEVLMIMAKVTGTGDHKLEIITDAGDKQVVAGQSLGSTTEQFSRQVNNCTMVYNATNTVSGTITYTDGAIGDVTELKIALDDGEAADTGTAFNLAAMTNGEHTVKVTAKDGTKNLNGTAKITVVGKDITGVTIDLKQGIRGDVDGNGVVNALDRIYLARYLAKWPANATLPSPYGADVDGSGTVNALDRICLARHLAKWPAYSDLNNLPVG